MVISCVRWSSSVSLARFDPKRCNLVKKDISFQLKMAETAKTKPVEAKVSSNSKEWEFDRPMTSKEKEEYFREKASQARKAGKAQVTHFLGFPEL